MMAPDDRDDWVWRDVPPTAPPSQQIDGSPLVAILAWAFISAAVILAVVRAF